MVNPMEKPARIGAPANENDVCDENCAPGAKPRGWLGGIFKKCALCAGSGAGGLLAGHAGCILAPLVIASAGLTTVTAGMPVLAVAFSAAATAGGLYLWNRLRGKTAGKWEKRIVIGSALVGLGLSSAFHLASGGYDHHHHAPPAPVPVTESYCGTPPEAAAQETEPAGRVTPPKGAHEHRHGMGH